MGAVKEHYLPAESTNWVFTINNPTKQDYDNLSDVVTNGNESARRIKYMVFGMECGSSTQNWHIQGYLESTQPLNFYELKHLSFLERAHIEEAKGTRLQNFVYCTKQNNYIVKSGNLFFPSESYLKQTIDFANTLDL